MTEKECYEIEAKYPDEVSDAFDCAEIWGLEFGRIRFAMKNPDLGEDEFHKIWSCVKYSWQIRYGHC